MHESIHSLGYVPALAAVDLAFLDGADEFRFGW